MTRQRINLHSNSIFLVTLLIFMMSLASTISAQDVSDDYKNFFTHYVDDDSSWQEWFQGHGITRLDVGKSFALIVGVSFYPQFKLVDAPNKILEPAARDIEIIEDYLKKNEFFNEIVVLKEGDVNDKNLKFFLQDYFPQRLKKSPKNRFLFTYSGHGFSDNDNSFLLFNNAQSMSDKSNSLNLSVLRIYLDETIKATHHTLVLLNACYGGAFLKKSFGKTYIPKHKGAHAITAGSSNELTWAESPNSGSIFFEKMITGLKSGQADLIPPTGDCLITSHELAIYLDQEIKIARNQTQNPQFGDISKEGSNGSFFFLKKGCKLEKGVINQEIDFNNIASGFLPITPSPLYPIKKFYNVWYSDKEYGFSELARNTEGGILTVNCNAITYQRGEEVITIKDIESVSHIKMSGDIARGWAKVVYGGNDPSSRAYFADGSKGGLVTLLGGSFEIVEAFSNCINSE